MCVWCDSASDSLEAKTSLINSKWLPKVNKQTAAAAAAATTSLQTAAWKVHKQTDQSYVSLKNACWRGRTVGSCVCVCARVIKLWQERCNQRAAAGGAEGSARTGENLEPGWSRKSGFLSKAAVRIKWNQTGTLSSSNNSASVLLTPKCQLQGLKRDKRAVPYDNPHNGRITGIFPPIGEFIFQPYIECCPNAGTNTAFRWFLLNSDTRWKTPPAFLTWKDGANRKKTKVGRTQVLIQGASG